MRTLDSIDTPLGPLCFAVRDGALTHLTFGEGPPLEEQLPAGTSFVREPVPPVRRALEAYFEGSLRAIDVLPVAPEGSAFEQAVWRLLREIPVGQTTSYLALALRLGKPGASRAVGGANGRNPVGLVIPCHRVVRADGALGGYAGGLGRKQWLLEHEGAAMGAQKALLLPLIAPTRR